MSELAVTLHEVIPDYIATLSLGKDEIFSLPNLSCMIRVRSGTAWITGDGQDIFLQSGESLTIAFHKMPVLLGALKGDNLVLELSNIRKPWLRLVRAALMGC